MGASIKGVKRDSQGKDIRDPEGYGTDISGAVVGMGSQPQYDSGFTAGFGFFAQNGMGVG
jgi:hypothetical protein